MAETIKVLTLNIWKGHFVERVVDFLKSENPDVVLLQEVTGEGVGEFEGVVHQGYQMIQGALGYEGLWRPMLIVKNERGSYELGVAVLTRRKVLEKRSEFYMHSYGEYDELVGIRKRFPGLLVKLKVEVGDGEVWMGSTHFVWSMYPEETQQQHNAADNLIEMVQEHERLILGGDFNLTDSSQTYKKLTADLLVDDRPKKLSGTLHPEIHKFAGKKGLAVDYLFHRGRGIKLIKSWVPMVPVSDHLPVVAEYELA